MKLLLLDETDEAFLRQAIEAHEAVYRSDPENRTQGIRWNVLRRLDQKLTKAEVEQIAQLSLDMFD